MIAVIGAGSWGTAFSIHLARKGHRVYLWVREKELFDLLREKRENTWFLPGFTLPPSIVPFHNLEQLSEFSPELIFVAVPAQHFRKVLERISYRPEGFISLAKGIELTTGRRMSEIIKEYFPEVNSGVLSGPSFALEVAKGFPTIVVIASENLNFAEKVQHLISDEYLRAYKSDDVIGVEICGAVKNVIAIAAGVAVGLGLGHNTLAALIVRGIAEMKRLVRALGGREETVAGIAGAGDLILTTTGQLSRNRRVGMELAKGKKLQEILASMKMVAEGVKTAPAIVKMAKEAGVEMPIAEKVYQVLYQGLDVKKALRELMLRRLKSEHE